MIVDIYQYFKNHPGFNKLEGDDYLFVEYKCPLHTEGFQLWSDCHMITYVISGRKDWITPGRTVPLKAGDAIFVRKGVHATRQYFDEDYCVMLFMINDQFISRFMAQNPGFHTERQMEDDQQVYELDVNESFESLINSLFQYFKQGGSIPRNLVEIKFQELLFNIALNPGNQMVLNCFNAIRQGDSNLENIMLRNFKYDLDLEAYARLCGKSLSSFKRSFTQKFQTSPAHWLTGKRLDYASSLLLSSDLNINEVCYECGFKNPSHFSRAFKNRFKVPPTRFKRHQALAG